LDAFIHHKKSLLAVVNLFADCAYTGQSFADGVAEILGAKVAIAKHNELHTFKVIGMKIGDSTAIWSRILGAISNATNVSVAEVDGEVLDLTAGMKFEEAKLGFYSGPILIYLEPSVQRADIGRKLASHVAAALAAASANNRLVWVLADNHPARQFYDMLGGG